MQKITQDEIIECCQAAEEGNGCFSVYRSFQWLEDRGFIVVKADSVVTRRRTDKELIKIMKDKGLEKCL